MKIEMTYEEFCDSGHEFLTGKGIQELENHEEIMCNPPDSSWYQETQGEHDAGPYGGHHWTLYCEEGSSLFAIARTSDFSRGVVFFGTAEEVNRAWEDILIEAWDVAAENGDLEECFNMDLAEYKENKAFIAKERAESKSK